MAVFRKTTKWSLFVYIMLAVSRLSAQGSSVSTLEDLVDSAQHHLPVLLQKKALVNAAKAGITDARHSFLPTTLLADELTVGTDNSLPGSYLSFGVIPSTSSGLKNTNSYQSAAGNIAILSGEYELVNFGLKHAKVRNAEAYASLSQADLDREVYLLKWQIGKLYFDILKNGYQLAIDRENVNRYETLYKIIQAVTRSGIKPGADSALAMAELSKTRISYNQTLGQIMQFQQQMSYLTGIALSGISIDTNQSKNYLSSVDMLAQGIWADSLNNPLIDYFARQKFLSSAREDLVRKSYLPKILLTGSAWTRGSSIDYNGNYNSALDPLAYQRYNYLGGLTLAYDLFNGVHRRDKLAISHNETVASDYELQQQALSLKNISNQAEEAIITAEKNLVEIPIQVRASRSAFDQKTAQYKAGIINLVDLTNASFVLYRAQSDYVQTLSDWLLANLDKAAASGKLDPFIHSIKN